MHLKLITPEKIIADETVDSVTLPGLMGEMTILPGHTMLVSLLAAGNMHYKKIGEEGREQTTTYEIGKGFIEVGKDNVVILTSKVSRPDQL